MKNRTRQPFTLTQQGRTTLLLPRKRTLITISSTPAHQSTYLPPSFSPLTNIEAVMKVKHLLANWLHRFTQSISPACDQYLQYLLAVVTHRSLINTDEGYHLRSLSFSYHCPHRSQPRVLHFPLMAPSSLRLTSNHSPTKPNSEQTLILRVGPSTRLLP
jgi:hypothetical protein